MPESSFSSRRSRAAVAARRWARRVRRAALLAGVAAAPLALWSVLPLGASGADQSQVEQRIQRGKATEQALSSAAAKLAKLEAVAERGIAVLERRQAASQTELDLSLAQLARTETKLNASRTKLANQQRRLRRDRMVLAGNLRASYMQEPADLMTVVVEAKGMSDLLERAELQSRARKANQRIFQNVRSARAATAKTERSLQAIVPEQRAAASVVRRERDALASRAGALEARRVALREARAARLAALRNTRADRRRAERTLTRLLAAQQKASVDKTGPGGPWSIPWAIVQCESGGQNTPPNSAGASGYYQFMVATWKGLGGSTPQAFQAGKAEQDRLAAKLWNNGAGAANWDCAAIVGLI